MYTVCVYPPRDGLTSRPNPTAIRIHRTRRQVWSIDAVHVVTYALSEKATGVCPQLSTHISQLPTCPRSRNPPHASPQPPRVASRPPRARAPSSRAPASKSSPPIKRSPPWGLTPKPSRCVYDVHARRIDAKARCARETDDECVFYDASQHGNTIYVSGQIGLDPATGDFVGDDVESQTERVMLSISEILKAAGANMSDVVKCNIFVTNMGDFAAVNAIYAKSTCRFRRSISRARPASCASRTPFCSCHSRTHTRTH